jgi:hypothetical protein
MSVKVKETLLDTSCYRMAPEVIACDENPDATYDNRVSNPSFPKQVFNVKQVT